MKTRGTKAMYGIGQPETDSFGRRCLLARKLVEAGVRFVQIFEGGWDSHDYLRRAATRLASARSIGRLPLCSAISGPAGCPMKRL